MTRRQQAILAAICFVSAPPPRMPPTVVSMTSAPVVTNTVNVILSWKPNSATNLLGYRLYTGTNSGVYATNVLTTTTNVTMILKKGPVYYFAVTATNRVGLESARSSEAVFVSNPPKVYTLTALTATNLNGPWVAFTNWVPVNLTTNAGSRWFKLEVK